MAFFLKYIGKIDTESLRTTGFSSEKVFISLDAIRHIHERRGDRAAFVISKIKDVLANPTKISDNSKKRSDSFIFSRSNGETIGVVVAKTKMTGTNQVISAFTINPRTYRKLIDVREGGISSI